MSEVRHPECEMELKDKTGDPFYDYISAHARYAHEVTQHWESTCNQFTDAKQAFVKASNALDATLAYGPTSSSDTFSLKSSLDTVDANLPKLAVEDDKLPEVSATLNNARNYARNRTWISRLPVEILSPIFGVLVAWDDLHCNHKWGPHGSTRGPSFTQILSSVSRLWRQVMTSTSSFWSHIDVRIESPFDDCEAPTSTYADLRLERAQNTPLELHLCFLHFSSPNQKHIFNLSERFQSRTIASLNVMVTESTCIGGILQSWLKDSIQSPLRALRIMVARECVHATPFDPRLLAQPAQMYANLLQLQTFNLSGVHIIPWDQVQLGGLIDFTIENLPIQARLTLDQLHDTLAASPDLLSLRVSNAVRSAESESRNLRTPVHLHKLKYLGLGCRRYPSVSHGYDTPWLGAAVFQLRQQLCGFRIDYTATRIVLQPVQSGHFVSERAFFQRSGAGSFLVLVAASTYVERLIYATRSKHPRCSTFRHADPSLSKATITPLLLQ